MACRLTGAKPLSEPMLGYCKLDHGEQISIVFWSKYTNFHRRKWFEKCRLENGGHFVSASICSFGSNWQYLNLGLDNGLVPNWRKAIIWSNDGPVHWRMMRHLAPMSYRNWYQYWCHCCIINDLGSSPQPEGEARGINFYSIMMKPN